MHQGRMNRICYPLMLGSVGFSLLLGMVAIWWHPQNETFFKLLWTSLTLALASGFVISATRIVAGGQKNETMAP